MARSSNWWESPWLWWAGGLGLLAWVYVEDPTGNVEEIFKMKGSAPPNQALAQALAEKWGPIFGAPPGVLLVLARIESGFRPMEKNVSPRALLRGGAWGLVQQTLDTAIDNAPRIAREYGSNSEVSATLRKWNGDGTSLLDPDVNMMFAAFQVGRLAAEFGTELATLAAGYHQGAGKLRQLQKEGKPIVAANLPPNGNKYVTSALAAGRLLLA